MKRRAFLKTLLGCVAAATALTTARAEPGSLDTSFNPGVGTDGLVYAVAAQADGKVLIGGSFTSAHSTTRNRIARLNANGTVDGGFNTSVGANDTVYAIALQPDGRVLLGGQFTSVNGTTRNLIARLTTSGTVDTSFDPGSGPGGFPIVNAIALLPDGRVVVAGFFSDFNGTPINNIAVLGTNGTVDTSFNPDFIDSSINALAVQTDGKILIGGDFTQISFNTHSYVARLNPGGSLDLTFHPVSGPDSTVRALALQADGAVVIGGDFHFVDSVSRPYLARLNNDGRLDTGFASGTGPADQVWSLGLQPDGKIFAGGFFIAFNGTNRGGIARVNANGSLDTTFNSSTGASGSVRALAVQSDGKVVIGGGFPTVNGTAFSNIARLIGDSLFEFTSSAFFVLENGGPATVGIRRIGDTNSNVTVKFATSNLTATAGADYTATNGTMTFSAGQTNKTFSVPIVSDALPEFNESFLVALSNPSSGARLGAVTNATVAIIETNSPGILEFETNTYRVGESSGQLMLSVHRTGGGTNDLTVNFATANGNALAGSDYVAVSGTLTFGPGNVVQVIGVPILDDWPLEGNESFSVRLTQPGSGAVLGVNSNANVTILDTAFSYEDLYGHMLRIEAVESVFQDQFFSSFSNRVTIRNHSTGTSLPGFVQLTSLDPALNVHFSLPSIKGGDAADVIVGGPANFAPDCPFSNPIGSCTNRFFATVFEPTTNGLTAQDSRMIFSVINTQPPTGGVPVGGGGLPDPRFNPPPFLTGTLITGPAQVDEGSFADFSAAALLSNNTTNTAVIPDWSSSAFQISSAGRLTTDEVSANTPVAVVAVVTLGADTKAGTNMVTVLNLPPPQISNLQAAGANFGFTITGAAGRRYAVDRAPTLGNPPPWAPLTTNTADASGVLLFSEPKVVGPGSRFFRARRIP